MSEKKPKDDLKNFVKLYALSIIITLSSVFIVSNALVMLSLENNSHGEDYKSNAQTFSIVMMALGSMLVFLTIAHVLHVYRTDLKQEEELYDFSVDPRARTKLQRSFIQVVAFLAGGFSVASGAMLYTQLETTSESFHAKAGQYAGLILGLGIGFGGVAAYTLFDALLQYKERAERRKYQKEKRTKAALALYRDLDLE